MLNMLEKVNKSWLMVFIIPFMLMSCGQEQDSLSTEVKYISFNIRNSRANDSGENAWENRKSAVKKMLDAELPSVFGLQEAYPEQLAYIDENFPQYSRLGVGRDDGVMEGEFMALYYRNDKYKLQDSGNFWLSETPDKPELGWDAACKRIVTWAKLKDKESKKVFYAFNTHLDHVGQVAREQSILLIVSKINEIVKGKNIPVFLSGDFNSNVSSEIFNPLKEIMSDSREFLPQSEWATTFNNFGVAYEGEKMIDYIFYKNAQVVSFETLNGNYGKPYISDHYPILAKFRF